MNRLALSWLGFVACTRTNNVIDVSVKPAADSSCPSCVDNGSTAGANTRQNNQRNSESLLPSLHSSIGARTDAARSLMQRDITMLGNQLASPHQISGNTTTSQNTVPTSTTQSTTTPSFEEVLKEASEIAIERQEALKRNVEDENEHRDPHPFWDFDLGEDKVSLHMVVLCATVLSVSGFLCSATGVGGNIIQVSLFMVMGRLSPHDAVPMSKVVVLSGAIGALVVHLSRDNSSRSFVSWELCRLAIPACLLGTVIGVSINTRIPDVYLVMTLSVLLLCISVWVAVQASIMHTHELHNAEHDEQGEGTSEIQRTPSSPSIEVTASVFALARPLDASFKTDSRPTKWEMFIAIALLLLVVTSGIMAELMTKCHDAVYVGWQENSDLKCHHPVLRIIFFGKVKGLALNRSLHHLFQTGCVLIPITACVFYGEYAAHQTLAKANATSRTRVRTVQLFLFVMGFIGSLTGVGGGIALSPFFIMLGLRTQSAVATSITCVIFISASSALQYIITNRVKMALACIYSCVNVVASVLGALGMHVVAGRLARPSIIMALICVSVLVSFSISVHRAFQMWTDHPMRSD
eukprot:TRINITY_DN10207_c0_g1_i1.p1 TRINITY_DN10207_c0_g1~~TRINITY_DN10207_c0_g1_i1.p1  ORF type:complete len:579 (-),score=68.07 TRINITY_DN10207_c0_g1_i1:201-1937(-)